MPELLLELGCEELPAHFVKKAYGDLAQAIVDRLVEAEIPFGKGNSPIGTPRRLIVHFKDVAERQPDREKEIRGPSVQAAYERTREEGARTALVPTKALIGFCKGQGVEPTEARIEGDYVWVTKRISGRATSEILQEILPESIRSLNFEKSMRWGAARMRFARPIRWIIASFGGSLVQFEIEGVRSDLMSRGHRFDNPGEFQAKTYDELVDGLIARKVEPDPAERQARIKEGAVVIATGKPEISAALLEENVFLTEWPTPVEGQFKSEYLELPEAVLVTAMAKHEKMFPVRGRDGKLVNRFIFVRNSGEDATVRAGAEWVLNARFNDAKFFFDEDKKTTLVGFLEKTSGILFQEKLGTVRARADRLSALAFRIAKDTGAEEGEAELSKQAGLYCKADLATGLVSELTSLQGVVGGEYAKREGFPDAVCWGIATHYDLSKNSKIDGPAARTAVRVLLSDQLDKLVGYLGVGLVPTGSSDPFGLRRAATMLIEAAWAWPSLLPSYSATFLEPAIQGYAAQGQLFDSPSVGKLFQEVFESRYESLLSDERPDLVEATKAWATDPQGAKRRLEMLKSLVANREFVQTATRPINILNAAIERKQFALGDGEADWPSRLASAEATMLYDAARKACEMEDKRAALQSLEQPINSFFDTTMVMDQNSDVRTARLRLVQFVTEIIFGEGGDFSKVVMEGA